MKKFRITKCEIIQKAIVSSPAFWCRRRSIKYTFDVSEYKSGDRWIARGEVYDFKCMNFQSHAARKGASRMARLLAIVLPAEAQQQVLTEILIRAVVINFLSRHRTITTFHPLYRPIASTRGDIRRGSKHGTSLSSMSKLIP